MRNLEQAPPRLAARHPGRDDSGSRARPFYDPTLSYQENYDLGPFGVFAGEPPEARPAVKPVRLDFLNAELRVPFGIPAGPLLNSKFIRAAFRWGYDLCHYKTVRTRTWPSHEPPNVLRVEAGVLREGGGPLLPLHASPFPAHGEVPASQVSSLSITNSFGMPAQPPEVWQRDVELAAEAAGPGQVLAVSVVGTVEHGDGAEAFALDFARCAGMAAGAGAQVVEANLSCPNVVGHGLLCHDIAASARVCERIKETVPGTPLLVKLGSYSADAAGEDALSALVSALQPYVTGFAAVNAVPAPVVDGRGEAALPGTGRLRAGICGAAITETGLDVVRMLRRLRGSSGAGYGIIGVGGVMAPEDFMAYRHAGADVAQGATGPMWRPRLALEIAEMLARTGA